MTTFEINEDMHVHSMFSDGTATVAENVLRAEALGLTRICCTDHVRTSTDWVPRFVEAVQAARERATLRVFIGVEAKILDSHGTLDLPANLAGVEIIHAADHQFPWHDGPKSPLEMREALSKGRVGTGEAISVLAQATMKAIAGHSNVVIAHLFSILPKVGLSESMVSDSVIQKIARAAAGNGASLEVSEKWRCPSLRTVEIFRREGVPVVFSSDSHAIDTLGRYSYNSALASMFTGAPRRESRAATGRHAGAA